ncbi:MAG: uncharacterized membrane protein (UPF0127 family) [Flavobacteriaceae bacterium]|jgi:uncharacterized membrane protein (UPF0127 family)|tara:strand:+ start:2856 stop:3101 length:246 start_codon:yes stop_codon:yes gene_type:complete
MLFVFDDVAPRAFYMKNTSISFDILYLNAEQEIVSIHRNTTPFDSSPIRSLFPAKYALELNAGQSNLHGITLGMKINYKTL